jgi:hypothetical protein
MLLLRLQIYKLINTENGLLLYKKQQDQGNLRENMIENLDATLMLTSSPIKRSITKQTKTALTAITKK